MARICARYSPTLSKNYSVIFCTNLGPQSVHQLIRTHANFWLTSYGYWHYTTFVSLGTTRLQEGKSTSIEDRESDEQFVKLFKKQFQVGMNSVQDLFEPVKTFFGSTARGIERASIFSGMEFLRKRYEFVDQYRRSQISYDASMASLEESKLGLRLTELV